MKKYTVVISQEARQNLKEITDYIRRTDSDSSAKYVRTEVLKLARSLVNLPDRYPTFATSKDTGIIYRYIPNKYKVKIIYSVENEDEQVIVVRIYHDRQRLETIKEELA